jgi:hypothetical protein
MAKGKPLKVRPPSKARTDFTEKVKRERPHCEIKSPLCTRYTTEVHEGLKRSAGGATVPGEKADRQGQQFWASCRLCNGYVEDHPAWAREKGFTISRYSKPDDSPMR